MSQEKLSRYLTSEFLEKIEMVLFSKRIRIAFRKLQRQLSEMKQELKNCEHKFQPYEPHKGSFQILCVYCAQYKPNQKHLQPSVYAFKGRSFAFKKKDRHRAPRTFETA